MSDLNAKFSWHLGIIIIQNTIHYNTFKRSHMMGWWPLNWISCEIQLTCQCIEKGLIFEVCFCSKLHKVSDNFKCQMVTFKFILVLWNNKFSNQIETFYFLLSKIQLMGDSIFKCNSLYWSTLGYVSNWLVNCVCAVDR